MFQRRIIPSPVEITFQSMEADTLYSQQLVLTNSTLTDQEISLKACPTLDRDYEITPSELRLSSKASKPVKISISSSKPGVYRDVIHIITPTFSEKIYVNLNPYEPTNLHLQDIVRDKDDQLQSSQSRIDRLEQEIEDLNEKLRQAHVVISEKDRVEQELTRIQQENTELRAIIEELRRNEVYHKEFKEMVDQKVPSLNSLIELTLRQEQEKHERKNLKILEILQIKDSLIEDLEDKCEELNNALTLMQHKLNDNKVLLNNSEKSWQGAQKVIEDLKTSNFEKEQIILAFKQKGSVPIHQEDSGVLKNELIKNFDHINQLTQNLQKLEQENSKLREREEYVLELSKRQAKIREDHERLLKDKDFIISELKGKVSMQTEHIESLASKLSQSNYPEILNKLSTLEEENKILSKRLADSQNSSLTFKQEDLDDNGKLSVLETENERLQTSLKEFTDRSQQLEKELFVKNREIIALQNEIIEHKRYKSEMILKAAPSPQEDLARLTSSLRQEQGKVQELEGFYSDLKNKVKILELNNEELSSGFQSLCENLESGRFEVNSQNKLVQKINLKLKILKEKEDEAFKAAALAEEGLKILQVGLGQGNNSDVIKELKKMQSELIQIKSKNEILTANNLKIKEELEEKRRILMDLQFLVNKDEKPVNKKLRKKVRVPPKLIKALLAAKIGESEAVKKLKQACKSEQDLKNQVLVKEDIIKRLKNNQQAGNLIQSSESSAGYGSEFDQNIQKKLVALEFELNELKEQERNSWESFRPLSVYNKEVVVKGMDDVEVLIEGILYLVDQIAFKDGDGGNECVEKAQRIVIRALSKAVQADEDKFGKVLAFVPSREEDRNIWYLEILEQHFRLFTTFVTSLNDTTQKLTGENSYSVSTSAGFKGLYLELTKSAKSLLDEINLIHLLCQLIKSDCQSLSKSPNQSKNLNTILSSEIEKATQRKTEEINETKKENQKIRNEFLILQEKLELTLTDYKSVQSIISQLKSKSNKLDQEKNELQKAVESLCQELKEETQLKEQALARVDKLHEELKDWQKAQIEVLTDRERTIIELQGQLKIFREEQIGTLTENMDLCRQTMDNESEQVLLQELNSLQQQNSELQKRVFELNKNFIDEKQNLLSRIAELEEFSAYSSKQRDFLEDSPSSYTLKKDPTIQLASLQVLLREKISALDEETRKRIDSENKLRSILLTESSAEQKMNKMEKEFVNEISQLHKEIEKYEKMLNQITNERDSAMEKFEQITEAFKASTESLRKAESQIVYLQEQQKNEVAKFVNKLKNSDCNSGELKSKAKEMNGVIDRLQKENEALNEHLGALEKEFEVTSMQLEDCEKVNANLKYKLKEYEQKIEDLEEMRVMESNGNSSRYEQLRLELKLTYEEFEKTVEMYEGQLLSLKDQIFNEIKKKGKKPAETVELMLQISKKDSIIKSLRSELKSIKPKKPEKKVKKFDNPSAEEEILSLQNQNFKLKSQIKNLEIQLQASREDFEKLSEPKQIETPPKKDIQEIERRHRLDLQKLAEEVSKLREKWHSPEEWSQVLSTNKDLEQTIRRLNDELSRKKEIVENLKAIKDQQDSENNIIQEELEQAKDFSEKVKKLRNELSRKEKMVFDLKSALEASKETEKKVIDDNFCMAEKIKALRMEVNRKDTVIKEFKSKVESAEKADLKSLGEELENLKDKLKKAKGDCERKDLQVKGLKSKLETAEIELDNLQAEKQNLSTDAFANLERELKKSERLTGQLRKTEAQFQSLCGITRKIFKELGESVEGFKGKVGGGIDKEYYSDCMNILNMDMKDLSEFVGQRSIGTTLCRIERLLEQGEDTGEILQIFSQLLEERLDLERTSQKKRLDKSRSTKIRNN